MNTQTHKLYSEEMERSALAKIFQNPNRFFPKIKKSGLKSDHFFVHAYQQIFTWLLERFENGGSFEKRILIRDFVRSELNEAIGDSSDILCDFFAYKMDEYRSYESIIDSIKADAALRIASKSISSISEGIHTQTPQSVVRSLSEAIEGISNVSRAKVSGMDSREFTEEFQKEMMKRMEGNDSLVMSTGISDLDEVTNGGFRNKELVIIAAPTSGGKSVLSLQACVPAIREEKRVCVFSLEMGVNEVVGRLVSTIGHVHMSNIIRPLGMTKEQGVRIQKAIGTLQSSNLKIWDDPKMDMDFIEEQVEESGGADLIVADYIQLIEGSRKSSESREQEVARISKRLKQLAKKFDCPVISPSQLNDDGKVRESRAIAMDADIVLQIIPEESIYVPKNRNGKRGVNLPLVLNGAYQKFEPSQNNHK